MGPLTVHCRPRSTPAPASRRARRRRRAGLIALAGIRRPGSADHVRLPVVEVELGGRADLRLRPLRVVDVGQAHPDLVAADPGDLRLGDAEAVGALADDLDRAVDVLPVDLGFWESAGPRRRARCRRAGRARARSSWWRSRASEASDHPDHEQQDEQVAPAGAHRRRLLGCQHEQQPAVVVVGGEEVRDGLGRADRPRRARPPSCRASGRPTRAWSRSGRCCRCRRCRPPCRRRHDPSTRRPSTSRTGRPIASSSLSPVSSKAPRPRSRTRPSWSQVKKAAPGAGM